VTYAPRLDADGNVDGFFTAAVDITERKREEERMLVISAELDHRVKNVLATVSGIARMTSRNATSVDEFRADFQERIQAMARTHSALAEQSWEGMSLLQLVQAELSPYTERFSDRLTIKGPDVGLVAPAIQPLSLAVHELATNAAKYGALSNDRGKLRIEWKTLKAPKGAVHILWKENGMKGLEPQAGKGFGTRVLENIVPAQLDAEASVEIRPTGLVCSLEIPAKWVRPS